MKAEKDGLDVLPDLHRYATGRTPIDDIPADDLDRLNWYGIFHREQTRGLFMLRLRTPGGRLTGDQLREFAAIVRVGGLRLESPRLQSPGGSGGRRRAASRFASPSSVLGVYRWRLSVHT